jgi:hypothetical protein
VSVLPVCIFGIGSSRQTFPLKSDGKLRHTAKAVPFAVDLCRKSAGADRARAADPGDI